MPSSITTAQAITIALAHHRAGRLAEAEGIYRQILSREPNHLAALDYLGVLAVQTGRLELAAGLLLRAIAGDPSNASVHCNLGECLRKCGKYDEAIAAFRQAIILKPGLAVAHNNLGTALGATRRLEDAVAAYQRAIELDPNYAAAHGNLANAYKDVGRIDEAISAARTAIALQPHVADFHNNLGVALATAGKTADAINAYRRALKLHPPYATAWSNLGNALADAGRHEDALEASRRAVELEPQTVQSHWNYAVILLRSGDLLLGWQEYEWRWRTQAHFPRPAPRFSPPRIPMPHWAGGDVAGQTAFLHAEQGFGDAIQFCRYAPLLAGRGATVVLEVHPELYRLMQGLEGVQQVVARGQTVPPFDAHCPLMSLPLAFGTTLETIPADIPYLRPCPELAATWRATLGPRDGRARIGICWAGSATHADDCDRSLTLSQFAPLAREEMEFFSLQKGPPAEQAKHPPPGMRLIDLSARLDDFADTAALIANLDLVITVDTAVAHLAGAMGKPVWVLVRWLSDWRWRVGRPDTPWYPTMRLFRQTSRGEWGDVIERVAKALSERTLPLPRTPARGPG